MAGMEDELKTLLQRLGGAEVGIEAAHQQLDLIRFVFLTEKCQVFLMLVFDKNNDFN